ncbi:somatostatin receptor type 4 [Nematostella vectensis]|uniref:somatostatin receptor type 4 n=1 Tax=Nematostella vectensis TaxID=45351 RepID=UPI00138FE6E6|nr:somatostatin receptor type 4 [Nematostella vectensis]
MSDVTFLVTGIVSIIVSITAITTNSLLLVVIIKNPLHCLRKPSSGYLGALAVADLSIGALSMSYYATITLRAFETGELEYHGVRSYLSVSGMMTYTSQVLLVVVLTFERFLSITCPIFHRNHVTFRAAVITSLTILLYSSVFSFVQYAEVDIKAYNLADILLHHLLPLATVPLAYFAIHRGLKKQRTTPNQAAEMQRYHIEKRLVGTVSIVGLLLVLTLTPYLLIIVLLSFCTACNEERLINARLVSILMLYVNSAMHPFIYGWRLRQYRSSFQAVFSSCKVQQQRTREIQIPGISTEQKTDTS